MSSLGGPTATGAGEATPNSKQQVGGNKTAEEDAITLTLAVKSTPSLNNVFKKRNHSYSRGTSKFFTTMQTQHQNEMPTVASEYGCGGGDQLQNTTFSKPLANLNILSHEDLKATTT